MASRRDLQALINRSDEAERDSYGGGWTPEDGQKFAFKVVKCTTKEKDGYPAWNITFEVTKGEDKGNKTKPAFHWFSEQHDFINQRTIDNFGALGVSKDMLWEDPEVVCEFVLGKTGVAVCEHRDSDNPNRPFVNYTLEPNRVPKATKKSSAKRASKRAKDDVDEDEEEETPAPKKRTRKAAAKKTTKKAAAKRTRKKPEPEPEPEEDELEDDEFEDEDDNVFDPDEEEDEDELEDDDDWEDEWEDDDD